MGQLFYSMSLAMGIMITFGSYMKKDISIEKSTRQIELFDTGVAFLSGLMVIPAVFAFSTTEGSLEKNLTKGAGLMFDILPKVFNEMPGGRIIGSLFFLFMMFAAYSTVIAVFENIMSFWLDLTKLSRKKVAVINIALLIVLSLPCILSCGPWENVLVFGKNFMDLEDYTVSNILLPVGSLIYVVFCTSRYGWGWKKFETEMNTGNGVKIPAWFRPYMTYVLPIIIIAVLVMSIF
ncbi:MAG: sodium-dependent transporter, partial [Clostridia bacterium]|nr:sodium-dependent transporter [Clostridia bacterium]